MRMMLVMTPRAPFVISRSICKLFITITFIPIARRIVSGSSLLCLLFVFLWRLARAYRSSRVNGAPLIVSSAGQMNRRSPVSEHSFWDAASFHCVRTACRGVIKAASAHGCVVKSTAGRLLVGGLSTSRGHQGDSSGVGRLRSRVLSIFRWCDSTLPFRRSTRKFLHMGSETRICSFRITTVLNSS